MANSDIYGHAPIDARPEVPERNFQHSPFLRT